LKKKSVLQTWMKHEMQEQMWWFNMLMLIQLLNLYTTWMWVVLPNLIGTSCLHLYGQPWRWKQRVPIKMSEILATSTYYKDPRAESTFTVKYCESLISVAVCS
jgi:hypothetical protein